MKFEKAQVIKCGRIMREMHERKKKVGVHCYKFLFSYDALTPLLYLRFFFRFFIALSHSYYLIKQRKMRKGTKKQQQQTFVQV